MAGTPGAGSDPRLDGLLRAMRSYQAGDTGARAPVVPGQTDQAAELCRLFNAIAERSALLETRTEPERADARDRAPAPRGAGQGPAALGEHTPAIVVFEDDAAGSLEPMRAAAESAVRGLGGTWERAGVLRVRTPAQVREAAAGGRVVCALLDARAPLEALLAVTDALGAAAPGVPVVLFAPDGNPLAGENAAAAVRDRDRAEIVRSSGQASERLTLHWLTSAPGADELTPETPDPGYGQARFEGEKVLIVDDDVRNIFAMVSALELYGLTALTADSGYEALEILQRTPDISVVLMDLMMPGLDGYGATARIRATPVGADLPIIAVTARSGESDREHSLAAGINEHVTKPVEVEHLLSLIRGLIRR